MELAEQAVVLLQPPSRLLLLEAKLESDMTEEVEAEEAVEFCRAEWLVALLLVMQLFVLVLIEVVSIIDLVKLAALKRYQSAATVSEGPE